MITTAVLDQIEERISTGESPDPLSDALARQYGLTGEQGAALWLLARREAEDPGHLERERRARAKLQPID
jgi:hypothetical protein